MKTIAIFLFMIFPFWTENQEASKFPSMESEFPLLWKAPVGLTSFRTNVSFSGNEIYIGSNGDNFYDYSIFDPNSGVYVLDRKTGKLKTRFADEPLGDMDVNGILLYQNRIYFGNDNEEFLCTDMKGRIIWRQPASGDIEHEPQLIKVRGKDIIVYASELGEVKAVDPSTGRTIWNYYTPDFTGFKNGDNRTIFKVKAFFSNSHSFFTKPLLADFNEDGITDLLYNGYDDKLYVLNGENGKLIWKYETSNSISFMTGLTVVSGRPFVNIVERQEFNYRVGITTLVRLDRFGRKTHEIPWSDDEYDVSLNSLELPDGRIAINNIDSIVILENGLPAGAFYHGINFKESGIPAENPSLLKRNGSDAVFASESFVIPGVGRCMVLLNQHDWAFWQHGFIELISLDSRRVMKRLRLEASAEMPPVIKDVNGDNSLDLLVGCNDGNLYCYDMKIKVASSIQ